MNNDTVFTAVATHGEHDEHEKVVLSSSTIFEKVKSKIIKHKFPNDVNNRLYIDIFHNGELEGIF